MVGGLMSTRRASSTRWWWWVIDLPPSGRFGKHGDRGGRPGFVEGDEDVVQDDGNGGESPVDALGLELVDSGEPQREVELVGGGFGQFVERLFFVGRRGRRPVIVGGSQCGGARLRSGRR